MIGDASCRVLMQLLAYAYPAYLTYKDIERGADDQLARWSKYWLVIAGLTALQPFMDTFLFFVPFYYSLKVAFACYLWANNLQGAEHVYGEYVRPFVRRYEPLVDFKLAQVRGVVSQVVSSNVSKAVQYMQMMLVKTLSQSVAERERERGGAGGQRMRRDESGSFHTAQEDFKGDPSGDISDRSDHSDRDRRASAYFDRTTSPLRAGGSGRRR